MAPLRFVSLLGQENNLPTPSPDLETSIPTLTDLQSFLNIAHQYYSSASISEFIAPTTQTLSSNSLIGVLSNGQRKIPKNLFSTHALRFLGFAEDRAKLLMSGWRRMRFLQLRDIMVMTTNEVQQQQQRILEQRIENVESAFINYICDFLMEVGRTNSRSKAVRIMGLRKELADIVLSMEWGVCGSRWVVGVVEERWAFLIGLREVGK